MPACSICKDPLLMGAVCPKDGGEAVPVSTVAPGYIFDKYMLDKKIGSGGMGSVWRGRHLAISRVVAIKFLNQRLIENPILITRFQREAQTVNEIRHKNLIDISDFGQLPDGSPYIVMEYLEGQSLGEYLKTNQSVSLVWIAHIVGQLCKGLQAAHDKGIIHRDLKPDNIFLTKEPGEDLPFVKILDFGIAKLSSGEQPALTRPDSIFGTPAYMSPEQCQGAALVDARTDIYSLGLIVYQMLTGNNPFALTNEPSGKVISKQISMTPPPMQSFTTRSISLALERFVQKALSKNPNERPETMSAFSRELLPLLDEAPDLKQTDPNLIPIPTPKEKELPTEPIKSKPKNRWWVLPLLALVSALVAGVYVSSVLLEDTAPIEPPTLPSAPNPPLIVIPPKENPPTQPTIENPVLPTTKPEVKKQIQITIKTNPEPAKLLLDGKPLGNSPYILVINAEEREATLRVEAKNFLPKEEKILLQKDLTVQISLKKKGEPIQPAKTCPRGATLLNDKCKCPSGKELSRDEKRCECPIGTIEFGEGRCGNPLDPLNPGKKPRIKPE